MANIGREPPEVEPSEEKPPEGEPHEKGAGEPPGEQLGDPAVYGLSTEYGLSAEHMSLFICTTCLELFDRPLSGRGGLEQQKCRCHHRPDEPRWAGYDFNERARLCDCCGRRVLRSGSRWSVWFCSACKDRIVSLNQEFGFAVIPIGRHSLMSGFGLQGGSGDAEVHGFFEQLQDMCRQIDILQDDWKPAHLREELERLELVARGEVPPRGIPLSTYLQAAADEDRTSGIDHRLRAFRALRETFTRS